MSFNVGDRVRIIGGYLIGRVGEVIAFYSEGIVTVRVDGRSLHTHCSPDQLEYAEQVPATEGTSPTAEPTEGERLHAFFFGQPEELYGIAKEWKADGRCPKCGELGRIHLSTFVCSTHGTY